ncbi:hypothetical protein HAX54_017557 [Datura stramonium]|uniref:Uncharacterized protein n=1 Tax=Datura stramonium TaxID=4076 RepID=A0ABS8ULP4_DATST|nr:hypothetical protein [Datura stramonium]
MSFQLHVWNTWIDCVKDYVIIDYRGGKKGITIIVTLESKTANVVSTSSLEHMERLHVIVDYRGGKRGITVTDECLFNFTSRTHGEIMLRMVSSSIIEGYGLQLNQHSGTIVRRILMAPAKEVEEVDTTVLRKKCKKWSSSFSDFGFSKRLKINFFGSSFTKNSEDQKLWRCLTDQITAVL